MRARGCWAGGLLLLVSLTSLAGCAGSGPAGQDGGQPAPATRQPPGSAELARLIRRAGQLAPGAGWRRAGGSVPPLLVPDPSIQAIATLRATNGGQPLGQVWLVRYAEPAAAAHGVRQVMEGFGAMAAGPPTTWRPEAGQDTAAAQLELAASSGGPRPTLVIAFRRCRHLAALWVQDPAAAARARVSAYARRLDAGLGDSCG
jgi:hypothetical protein